MESAPDRAESGALVVASVAINLMSGRPRATAPDDAVKAAAEIVDRQGGGEQPRNQQGVPADAVVDQPVGTMSFGK